MSEPNTTPQQNDQARIRELLQGSDPLKFVFAGDSITMGVKHTHGWRSYPELFSERVRWDVGRRRDVIINTGVSGNTAGHVLEDFDWRIAQFQPDIVSLMIGGNDANSKREISPEQFGSTLLELLGKIRGLNALPIFQTPNNMLLDHSPERKELPAYVETMRGIAADNSVLLIDHWAHWKQQASTLGADGIPQKWLNDPLHPNELGHQQIAELIFQELSLHPPENL